MEKYASVMVLVNENKPKLKRSAPSTTLSSFAGITESCSDNTNCKIISNHTISIDTFREVLKNINILLASRSLENGQRFRASHRFTGLVPRQLVFQNVKVCAVTTTTPRCLICGERLRKDEPRMKHSVYYPLDRTQCDTHAYHVDCFLVSQCGKLPDSSPVCIAACANTGCKISKKAKLMMAAANNL